MSGSVFLVAEDRVRPANVPLATAIASLRRCGIGAATVMNGVSIGAPGP
jgi:hypothetical protein